MVRPPVTPELMNEIDQPLALAAPSSGKATSASLDRRIEITVPDGTCVRVGADVGLMTLRRIMAAVRR